MYGKGCVGFLDVKCEEKEEVVWVKENDGEWALELWGHIGSQALCITRTTK